MIAVGQRPPRAALAAAVGLFALVAFTSSAAAGTYAANPAPCQLMLPPSGAWAASAWAGGIGCNSGNADITITGKAPGSNPNKYMWFKSQELRQSAYLKSFNIYSYYSNGHATTQNPAIKSRGCQRNYYTTPVNGGSCAGYDFFTLPTSVPSDNSWGWRAGTGDPGTCASSCSAIQFEVHNPVDNLGSLSIGQISAQIGDDTLPAFSPSSDLDNPNKWVAGSVTLAGSASDEGAGVSSVSFYPDTSDLLQVIAQNTTCSAGAWHPCPTSYNWNRSFDTNSVADGAHTGRWRASDYAGNASSTSDFTYQVDNTNPDAPTGVVAQGDGLEGWSQSNSFDASWTNGAEVDETATQSGLAYVRVDVVPTEPLQSDPAPVDVPVGGSASGMSATSSEVTGITLPAKGAWSIKLALLDAAGNLSADGTNSDGSSEIGVGWGDSKPPKADGRSNGWISRNELATGEVKQEWNPGPLAMGAPPTCGYGVAASQNEFDDGPTTITVAAPTTEWAFPTDLPEGTSWVHIRSINCSQLAADLTEHIEAKVDLTDPIAAFSGVEEGRWYQDGQELTLSGSDALSGMTGADPDKSDSRLGAYITYDIDGVGPAPAESPRGDSVTLPMTGEGIKTVSFAPVDLAGNQPARTVVRFGIDATDPEGYLESQDPETPTLLRAPLGDALSGIGSARISVRDVAGGPWHQLETALGSIGGNAVGGGATSGVALARFPDTKLKGEFEVRVAAFDQAGNPLVTNKDKNGQTHTVTNTDRNPMRTDVGLSAAIYKALRKCKRVRIKSKSGKNKSIRRCPKKVKRRGKVYFRGGRSFIKVRYKRAGVVQGYLATSKYKGLAGQPIEVTTKAAGKSEVGAGSTATRSGGAFSFRVKPGVSRQVNLNFPGSEKVKPASASVHFGTQAHVSLKVSSSRVRSGGKVTFRGRVSTFDRAYPKNGKIVTLQFLSRGKWRPAVAIVRTNARGYYRATYRFSRMAKNQRARIRFRIWAPTEAGFSHASTPSRPRLVSVN